MRYSLTGAALLVALPTGLARPGGGWGEDGHPHGPPLGGQWGPGKQWGPPGPPGHQPPPSGSWGPWTGKPSSSATSAPSSTPTNGGGSSGQVCDRLTTADVEAAGNNTLFTRWRPHSHFMAPAGWMNDPCGAMYDPVRDVYHLSYQWHPYHINWGNISWGSATSKDLITWEDHDSWEGNDALILGPTGFGNYNGLGIFSGTAQPVNLQGEVDGTLLAMYTSVSWLPTNWQITYHPYTETQSLAISKDGGETWQEYEGNPVINATTETAPMFWNLTGFRDPFLEPLPSMDELLGMSEPHFYAVFGSGIKGVGPRMPLWTAPASDLTSWSWLGALWTPADNTSLGPLLTTGTYGFNFEVSGFFALPDSKGDLHYFAEMGTEGGNVSFHESAHWALWNEGTISRRENGSAQFTPRAGAAADWGLTYALTSFNDTKNNRRVQWGWAPEDLVADGGLFSAQAQGFQGSHTLPRELFVHEVSGVEDVDGAVSYAKEAVLVPESGGTYTAQTLGIRPLSDVVAGITANASHKSYGGCTYTSSKMLETQGDAHMELKATVTSTTGSFGLVVGASPDGTEYTTISWEPNNNTVLVNRDYSSTIEGFANSTVTGYFRPYTVNGKTEDITFDIFLDGSLLEIYINERFALATRIYPSQLCATGYGIYAGDGESVTFRSIDAWLGTLNVWPSRPLNSSSELVWDTAAETNNYTWWSGN